MTTVPDFDTCTEAMAAGTATPLQAFVYDYSTQDPEFIKALGNVLAWSAMQAQIDLIDEFKTAAATAAVLAKAAD